MRLLNIAVIGAGASGLCTAKHADQRGLNVTIYEQAEVLGGTWHYTDTVGKDKYGINVHTSMYQGVKCNSPNQVMEFPDHHFSEDSAAYSTQATMLEYIHSYADRFGLRSLIKFSHFISRVSPIENGRWEICVKDLPNNSVTNQVFDAIFVCTGHYAKPFIPDIMGVKDFSGNIFHCHDFRSAEHYRGQQVLVIGTGPSGMDLVYLLSKTSENITFSRRAGSFELDRDVLPSNCIVQGEVKRFTTSGAEFYDGTHATFDTIIWATGYVYEYPFLSDDCRIHVDEKLVQPLFKQIINIHHPTMAFIGIPHNCCLFPMFDLQVRFALQFITGARKLPTKQDMLDDMHLQTQIHQNKGYPKHMTHFLGHEQVNYYKQLSEAAGIENIPDVLVAIHLDTALSFEKDPTNFRQYKYTIIDEKTFKKERENNKSVLEWSI